MALNCGCGADAHDERRGAFSPEHPGILIQRRIEDVLHGDQRTLGGLHVAGEPVSAREWLCDMSELVRRVLFILVRDPQRLYPTETYRRFDNHEVGTAHLEDLAQVRGQLDPTQMGNYARAVAAGASHTPVVAVAMALAARILDVPTFKDLRDAVEWMPRQWRINVQQRAATNGVGLSEPLLAALTHRLRQTTSGWLSSITLRARLDIPEHQDLGALTQTTAANLHPALAAALPRVGGEFEGATVIAGLLATLQDRSVQSAAADLNLGHIADSLAHTWRHISTRSGRDQVSRALIATFNRDHVTDPVNFGRRRALMPDPVDLPERVTSALARELDARNTAALRLHAAMFCWERITGASALLSHRGIGLPGVFRMRYRRHRNSWNTCLPLALREHLLRWAAQHNHTPIHAAVDVATVDDSIDRDTTAFLERPQLLNHSRWREASLYEPHLVPLMVRPVALRPGQSIAEGDTVRLTSALLAALDEPTDQLHQSALAVEDFYRQMRAAPQHVSEGVAESRGDLMLVQVARLLASPQLKHRCRYEFGAPE
jgi:hypothetical protein